MTTQHIDSKLYYDHFVLLLYRINEKGDDGQTALLGACKESRASVVDYLLDHNVSLEGIRMSDAIRSCSLRLIALIPGPVSLADVRLVFDMSDPVEYDTINDSLEMDFEDSASNFAFHVGMMTALKAKGASLENVANGYPPKDRKDIFDVAKAAGFDIGPYERRQTQSRT